MANKKEYEMLFQLGAKLNSGFTGTFSKAQQQLLSMQKEIDALNKAQSDISAYQKQQKAVENTNLKLEKYRQQQANIQEDLKNTSGATSTLKNKSLELDEKIRRTTEALRSEEEKLKTLEKSLGDAGVNTKDLATSSQNLTGKIDALKSKQEEAAEGAKEFGNTSSNAISLVSDALVAAGLAAGFKKIASAYKECVAMAGDFEETISTVEALSGASAGEIKQLSEFAKELGATTKFTARESAEAMTYMGMAGWNAQQMMSGMDGVLKLAAASGEDLAMVSDIVTDNLTAFGLKASDTAHFSDVLASAATNSNTSVGIMGETFKNCASLAGALDYSIEDVAVAVGLMANAGVKGSKAGTALKNVFGGLLDGVTLSGKALGTVTYSAINADGTMKSFGETIKDLRKYFDQMTGSEKLLNAKTLAGERAMAGFVSIMNSADEDFKKLTDNINGCAGAASKMADIKLDNLNGQLTLMNSAADAVKTTLGEQFNPELRATAKIGTTLLTELNDFMKNHPTLIKAILASGGAVMSVSTAMVAFNKATNIAKALNLASVFTGAGPILWTVAAVGALTAAVVGGVEAYKKAQEAARQYGQAVTEAAESYQTAMAEANDLDSHIAEWKELNSVISSGTLPAKELTAAKERLKETEQWLIDNYGIYLDSDGRVSEEEIASLSERNELLRETVKLRALIALDDAKKDYNKGKEKIGDNQEKLDNLEHQRMDILDAQMIVQKYQNEWDTYKQSYENAWADTEKYIEISNAMAGELSSRGLDFSIPDLETADLSGKLAKKDNEISKVRQYILEYKESALAYQEAAKIVNEVELVDIPTGSIQELYAAGEEIGRLAANAELGQQYLNKYAEELTKAAHAAGLLPENQEISFNAGGAIQILEVLTDKTSELNGKTVTITADADAKTAIAKIGDVSYKVLKYDKTTGTATLSIDGKKAYGELDTATGRLKVFNAEEATAAISVDPSQFNKDVANAKEEIKELSKTKITITATLKTAFANVKQALGMGYAAGTISATKGFHLVGEKGPEIVYFNGGEQVLNATETAAVKERYAMPNPIGATASSNHNLRDSKPINITNNFNIEGNASSETVNALSDFGDSLKQMMREVLEDVLVEKHRMAYV